MLSRLSRGLLQSGRLAQQRVPASRDQGASGLATLQRRHASVVNGVNGVNGVSKGPGAGAEFAQEFYGEEEFTKKGDEVLKQFTYEQRYLFDLNGFLVVRNVLSKSEIEAANAAFDEHVDKAAERQGILRNTRLKSPLSAKGNRLDLAGMLSWEPPYRDVFRSLLVHPGLVPALTALLGPGYRMDHMPLGLVQNPGSEGFALHGGPLSSEGRFNPTLQYRCVAGDIFNSLLAMSVVLSDHGAGDGGFCVVRGSHKSNFPIPRDFIDGGGDLGVEHLHQPVTKAGDVIFFSEATVHGALPWRAEHQRRVCLYRFAPATVSYGRAYSPDWPEDMLDGMTVAQRAILEPPYAGRLDRPIVTRGGDEEPDIGAPRPQVKKSFDLRVFGQKYF